MHPQSGFTWACYVKNANKLAKLLILNIYPPSNTKVGRWNSKFFFQSCLKVIIFIQANLKFY
jgi:hypothetical protein